MDKSYNVYLHGTDVTSPHGAKKTVTQTSKFIVQKSQSAKEGEQSKQTEQKNIMHVKKRE